MKKPTQNFLKVGTLLDDKWLILEFIAKGGMGEVYRAHQLNLKRDVAIKVISKEWLESLDGDADEVSNALNRFLAEVQAMAFARHTNIIHIYDFGSAEILNKGDSTRVEYLAMEYIPGNTLRETMSEEGFHPDENAVKNWITTYFLPVLDGVEVLHMLGIVHRDLKPENVLMDKDTPKIADFGLAHSNRMMPVTRSIDVKGSPPYMSPEHFFDLRRADQRADIYSLGKILFEAVVGKITSKIIPFQRASLPMVDTPFFQKLDRIIRDATAENKEERLESVELFRNALKKIVVPSNPERPAPVVLSSGRLPSSVLRHWLLAFVAVAVTAAFSIAAVNSKDSTVDPDVPGVVLKQSQTDSYRALRPDSTGPVESPQSYRAAPTNPMLKWGGYPDCDETDSQWQR